MSGTSIDGVDAVLADFEALRCARSAHVHVAFDDSLPDRQS
jgi:1,6-anhydro-N-acetylmuramate kinase